MSDASRTSVGSPGASTSTGTRDGELPASLNELSDAAVPGVRLDDPETGQPYGYRVLTGSTFELCGHFETDWSPRQAEEFWSHPPGDFCFELDVREVRRRRERAEHEVDDRR